MAGTFSNPRLSALPCERMRGALFAEDFVSEPRIEANAGVIAGAGYVVDRGLTMGITNSVTFDPVECPGDFSIVVKFKTTTQGVQAIFSDGLAGTGFWVNGTATGIECSHNDGVTTETIEHPCTYNDGTEKTVTYSVNKTAGTHHIIYEDEAPTDGTTAVTGSTGGATGVVFGFGFAGTGYKARIYSAVLTQAEHDLIRTDTLTAFMDAATAIYRCDDIGDDTDGNVIWDRTVSVNDLTKGDKATAASFPEFITDKYFFDLVDDYVSDFPELATEYTISAIQSSPQDGKPYVNQDSGTTLKDELTTAGGLWGYLHNMMVLSKILTGLEAYQAEYHQLYWLTRGRAYGAYHRLITEETCKVAMFMDYTPALFRNDSRTRLSGYGNAGVAPDGANGCDFSGTGVVTIPANTKLDHADGTIFIHGDFSAAQPPNTFADKGTAYKFIEGVNTLSFYGSSIAHTFLNDDSIAVTWENGYKPRFHVNGYFIGEGNVTVAPTVSTNDVLIGNNIALTSPCRHSLKQVYIGDAPLSDAEILALHEEAKNIGAKAMEVGARTEFRQVYAGAIDEDINPGQAFQLIDVVLHFAGGVVPTTSELCLIKIINSSLDEIEEHSFDPSVSTRATIQTRFDKRHTGGRTINIVYPNSDPKSTTLVIQYQTDDSVT